MNIAKNKHWIHFLFIVFILLKVFLYYVFMEVSSNFLYIYCLTFFYILIIFLFFENKRIPAVLYLLFSILMFIDAAYFSYFNRNLSIVMLGAAGLLGNVTDSIFKVIKLKFFFLIIDAGIILLYTLLLPEKSIYKINDKGLNVSNLKSVMSVVLVCLISFTVLSSDTGSILTSVYNQEFFTYHMKDVFMQMENDEETNYGLEGLSIDGTYKSKKKNALFGIAKNRNLIVIQVESLQEMVIQRTYNGQEITPNFNALIKDDSLYFNHYYQQLASGNSSDAEFVSQNSLYGAFRSYTYSLYNNNYFHGLPWILKDEGYKTIALHGYKKDFWNREAAYPGQGFDKFISEEDFEIGEPIGFGLNDVDFFEQSVNYLKTYTQPFYGFLITLTSHHPYEMPEKHRGIQLKKEDQNTLFGNYLEAVHYTDEAIGKFIEHLKENNLYDNSIIAIYGDHFGLNYKEEEIYDSVSRFLGYPYDYDEMLKIPLVIHIPGSNTNKTIETTGGQIDFMPTIAYLMGIEKMNTIYFGQNLVNAKDGFVASQTYMLKGSFIDNNNIFEMPRDGIVTNGRAWNIHNRESVDLEKCKEGYMKAINQVNLGNYILENDVIRQVLLEKKSIEAVIGKEESDGHVVVIKGDGFITQEALDNCYEKGAKYIEVDVQWTSDGYPVLFHDWNTSVSKYFRQENKQLSLNEFKNLKFINGWRQMDMDDLAVWIKKHQDVYIIPDVSSKNIEFLEMIKNNYSPIMNKIIPQINQMDACSRAEYLGYPRIIFKADTSLYSSKEIFYFVMLNDVFAVTIPVNEIEINHELFELENKSIYAYGVNGSKAVKHLIEKGVDGIYTENLNLLKK